MKPEIDQYYQTVCTKIGRAFPWHEIEGFHGEDITRDFRPAWMTFEARDYRAAVLLGVADKRQKTTLDDAEPLAIILAAIAYGSDKAALASWILDDATPSQMMALAAWKAEELPLEPQETMPARVLIYFCELVFRNERLPSKKELHALVFPNRKIVAPKTESKAYERTIDNLGLRGLPAVIAQCEPRDETNELWDDDEWIRALTRGDK